MGAASSIDDPLSPQKKVILKKREKFDMEAHRQKKIAQENGVEKLPARPPSRSTKRMQQSEDFRKMVRDHKNRHFEQLADSSSVGLPTP